MSRVNMRDQYNFLKAIDTSSSSPELKETHRPRRQQATTMNILLPEADSSSISSNSNKRNGRHLADNGRERASLIRSKLQNFIRPRRFQLSSSGESKSSSSRQLVRRPESGQFACQEDADDDDDDDDNLDDSDEEPEEVALNNSLPDSQRRKSLTSSRRVLDNGDLERVRNQKQQPTQQVPIICQTRKRPLLAAGRAQVGADCAKMMPSPSETKLVLTNQTKPTTKTSAVALQQHQPNANYSPSETNSAQLRGRLQEQAKCYDEIDQIYDYIRGLAPLPANLRKIKAIDFEQIERERQRVRANQRQPAAPLSEHQSVRMHHLHRQRFVKMIESPPNGGQTTNVVDSNNENSKKSAKVRQRVAAELIEDRAAAAPPQAHRQPSKLRETLQFLVPRPIRVTTKTSESQRPSIKRVESLNLGPANLELSDEKTLGAKLMQQKGASLKQPPTNCSRSPSYQLLKAGANGRSDQMFRLPRAHSTSTLSKPTNAPHLESHRKSTDKFGAVQPLAKLKPHHEESIREESPPVARLKGISYDQNTSSLQRGASKKRPSFESELVESYVDDEEEDEDELCDQRHKTSKNARPQAGRTSSSSASLKSPHLDSASGSWGRETAGLEMDNDESRLSSPASERWSYADDSRNDQRLADKSHSDYDNDSTSETDASTSTETTTTTSESTSSSTGNSNEEDAEIRRNFGKDASGRRQTSSKRSHQLRPTTSSSPSSGRPASPVDMTHESDEIEMLSVVSRQDSSCGAENARNRRQKSTAAAANERPELELEHIYEQIPSQRDQSARATAIEPTGRSYHQKQTTTRSNKPLASLSTSLNSAAATPNRASGNSYGRPMPPTAISHPVAYAANVATNRRYQQQVAALFTLQQQRSRHQQLVANSATSQHKLAATPLANLPYHPSHQRRASASSSQFVASHANVSAGPLSLNAGSLKWKHHQTPRELTEVPHRQRLSMSNIHLLSGAIPLASLCSPRSKQQQLANLNQSAAKSSKSPLKTTRKERIHNASLLDDHEAGSTGTTNSTSSYEAAIKNSEPDPLRIDMISPPSDGEQSRPASSKRSIGSASGSRSLSNQSNQVLQQNTNGNTQQPSMLMKVPKLSKQSHLLKRPLPKPPSTSRSYGSSSGGGGGGNSRQPQKVSGRGRSTAGTQSTAIDVFS